MYQDWLMESMWGESHGHGFQCIGPVVGCSESAALCFIKLHFRGEVAFLRFTKLWQLLGFLHTLLRCRVDCLQQRSRSADIWYKGGNNESENGWTNTFGGFGCGAGFPPAVLCNGLVVDGSAEKRRGWAGARQSYSGNAAYQQSVSKPPC